METTPSSEKLITQVNTTLNTTSEKEIHIATLHTALADYIKTIPLPAGAAMENLVLTIDRDKIVTTGEVRAASSVSDFQAMFEISPTGELRNTQQNIHLAIVPRPFMPQIERSLAEINRFISTQLDSEIPLEWQIDGFDLVGANIAMKYKKRPSIPQVKESDNI